MHLNLLPVIIPLLLFLNQIHCSPATNNSPDPYHPLDDITVNCGSSGSSTAVNGRRWTGDIGSSYTPLLHSNTGKLIYSKPSNLQLSPDPVPFLSARLSRWPFAYTFRVSPGQKFVRLHFYPASYRGGFRRSKAFFTVKAGPYTLLSNFSASLTADALGLDSIVKEFCVNVEENHPLIITFSPSIGGYSDEAYAFVNGIEIVSMPDGLYHTQEGGAGAHHVGQNFKFPVDKSIALETVQRLNVGGTAISSMEDTGLFRDWSQDKSSLMAKSYVQPVTSNLRIKYTGTPSYTASQKVYQTSWSMATNRQRDDILNVTWKLPIDFGFRYLLRLHFCDFEYEIEESDHRKFSIFFDEHVAEAKADVVKLSGGNRVAVYRDYVVMIEGDRMEGKHDLLIAYFPHNHESIEDIDTILKGLEVFKLSNPDKNLAGVNPVPLSCALTSSNAKTRKFVYGSGGNAVATVWVILLIVTNIFVYMSRVLVEKFGGKNNSRSVPEGLCRRFSLSELFIVTHNFSHEFFIGKGGFGDVYKAHIDNGTTAVAIKRLNSKSKQGADEFQAEIESLSNLRHKHLVSLIGYCDERQEMILVYDYMEHGTLADHLYKHNDLGNGVISHLSWEQRMEICIGAAHGLDYLHTGAQRGIIHRDIKTTNILLDKDWVAKISDLGLCKEGSTSHSHSHVTTDVKGTFGYLDPEYFLTRRLTKKSDVYAFGVVLLEVLCGRPAVDISLEEEQRSLAMWAQKCITEEKLDQLVDSRLRDQVPPEYLKTVLEVANKCLDKHPRGRPTMAAVVGSLERMLASQEQPRNACTEEEEVDDEDEKGEEVVGEEEGAHVHGDSNQQIYYDTNTQKYNIPGQGTVASPSTPVQFNENTQHQKKSKKNMFQRGIAFLARVKDISSMKVSNDPPTSNTTPSDESKISGNWQSPPVSDSDLASPDRRMVSKPTLRIFSYSELKNATKNFRLDSLLGEGRFGQVYRGMLSGEVTSDNSGFDVVAVKKLDFRGIRRFEDWQSEVTFRGGLFHSNLVKLLGYCWEVQNLYLVYEFMSKGSLENRLFGRGSAVQPLPWSIRLNILLGAARGLAFLHTSKTPIIFKEFTTSNILLDDSFNPKISDFGYGHLDYPEESDCWYVPTRWPGSARQHRVHVAPEYGATGHLGVKGDVYSFGVVLLEMLTGLRAVDVNRPCGQQNLVAWVTAHFADRRKLARVMDPRLEREYPPKAATRLAALALQCLGDYPKHRPSMEQVVETLAHINLLGSDTGVKSKMDPRGKQDSKHEQ